MMFEVLYEKLMLSWTKEKYYKTAAWPAIPYDKILGNYERTDTQDIGNVIAYL